MPKAISPMTISPRAGTTGFGPSSVDSVARCRSMAVSRLAALLQDERNDEADQREGFGQREAEEQVGPGQAGRLRLSRGRLDVRGEDDAHADTGADRGEAVAQGLDTAVHFC